MNLVFFDIECASVSKTFAKICAFGYVLADENFNVIKKEDILINPKGKFHLTDRKGDKGIVLPYEYSEFKNYPPFKNVYPFIKDLLEDKNNIVLGHATSNDVKYLNLETKRYKLPSFNFSFSDSQILYSASINDFSHSFGLEHIAESLNVDFTPHRAADDAFATMKVVEALCKSFGADYLTLKEKLKVIDGKICAYSIKSPASVKGIEYRKKIEEAKNERAESRIRFFNYASKKRKKLSGKFSGKVFTFSQCFENDFETGKKLLDKIFAAGGTYSHRTVKCNYFVKDENDQSARVVNAGKLENLKIISVSQLEEMLGV